MSDPGSLGTSLPKRVALATCGALLLLASAILTVGLAVAGLAAMGIGLWLQRRASRPLTRIRAWIFSVIGAAIPTVALLIIGFATAPKPTPQQQREALARSRGQSDSLPPALRRLLPVAPRGTPATDSAALKVMAIPAIMIWFQVVGSMFVATILGGLAGSLAWASVLLIHRGVADRWLGTGPTLELPPVQAA